MGRIDEAKESDQKIKGFVMTLATIAVITVALAIANALLYGAFQLTASDL